MAEGRTSFAAELQALYAKGDFAGVIAVVRAHADAMTADADALLFAGLAFAGAGLFGEAADHLRSAFRLRPLDPGVKGALARVLLLRGEEAEAELLMRELAEAARADAAAALHLSDTYLQAGRSEDAFHLLSKAIVSFDHPLIDARLAEAAIRTRRFDDGVAAARRTEKRLGAHPSALNVAGPAALIAEDQAWLNKITTEIERRPVAEAAVAFDKWAEMLLAGEQWKAALFSAERAAELQQTAPRWRLVCDLRLATRETSTAEKAALAALAFDPQDAAAMTLLARCRMMSGDIADARNILLNAVRADPASAVAFDYLTQIDPNAMTADMAAHLDDLLSRNALPNESRAKALLSLARRNETGGDTAKAFAQIIEAKEIVAKAARAAGGGYKPHDIDVAIERMKKPFVRPMPTPAKSSRPRLIFIIGMPRSGTSLVEQILSSHSVVYGAGELPDMVAIMKNFDERIIAGDDPSAVFATSGDEWRARYLAALPAESRAAEFVTDKHPMNFWSVGVIRALFPDVKIVNLQRSPAEVCLSILRLRFFAQYTFANEIEAVAHYYAAYERLMAHWRSIFADTIYDVGYERLVAEPERETRALLAHCGLAFDEKCLDFHKTKRTVLTHSAAQVREPINTRAIERRKQYGDTLKPLEEALTRYGVTPQ